MIKHVGWPSIGQFRQTVLNVTHNTCYVGQDSDGNAKFNPNAQLPTLQFEGTVKLHGTNASLCLNLNTDEIWCQSREDIITPGADNAGFATAMHPHLETVRGMLAALPSKMGVVLDADTEFTTACIFGEWCGKGINKTVAVAQLPKMFVVFSVALATEAGHKVYASKEVLQQVVSEIGPLTGFKCIYDFPTYSISINFKDAHEASDILTDIALAIEHECPVGKAFGVSGIGEGAVWKCVTPGWENSGFWFKVKGKKHAPPSKSKSLAPVDVERIQNIKELAARLTPEFRLEQMFTTVFNTLNGGLPDVTKLGDYIRAVLADILKEEMDVIAASGFVVKEFSSAVSANCVRYFREQEKLVFPDNPEL